jgi:ubiquinone/menaquinone biosynthesis C-methylase UbiE
MPEPQIDKKFVRECWEDPSHLTDYVEAVNGVGLWDSERLLVEKYLSKTDRVLDIGCGAGRATIGLYRLGYLKVQGVDLSRGMIDHAVSLADKGGYPIPFEVGDATDLQYDDRSFNAALFTAQGFMCIPGADRRLAALREIRRVLRPGGHLIFTTHERHAPPEFASFWEEETARWENGTQDRRLLEFGDRIARDSGVPTYIHIPARNEVAKMVAEAGLAVVEDTMRSDLSSESDAVRWTSSDCRMWVAQRPSDGPAGAADA